MVLFGFGGNDETPRRIIGSRLFKRILEQQKKLLKIKN